MVDLTEVAWTRASARVPSRALGSVLLVIGVTAGLVAGTRFLVSFGGWDPVATWAVLAGGMGLFALRRLMAGSGRSHPEHEGTPVIIRRDGTPVHGEARRHRRFVPQRRATRLHLRDGREVAARILDISIAGVAIEARISELEFLSVVQVGSRAAGPVRRTPIGAVFGFDTLLEPQPFDASFVL